MILQKMKLDEENVLEFTLDIFGTTQNASSINFIIEGPTFGITCPCSVDGNSISVKIPKLKNILGSGVYESKLNVVVDGKIFTPLSESVEFEPLIEFSAGVKKVEPVKEGVSVKLKNATPSFEDSNPSNYTIAEEEGFEVVKIKNFDVLKKDDQYWGFVSEKAILKADQGYNTLTELMESM